MSWARATPRLLVGVLALLSLGGCSIQKMAADSMVPVFQKSKDELNRVPVARYAREAAPGLLATLDSFALASPDNPELRLLQAEMNASFAFAFLDLEDPEWATFHYRVARAAAKVALAAEDEDLAAGIERWEPPAIRAALEDGGEDLLPAAFWWAFARGAEINLHRGDPKQVKDIPRVDAVMEWAVEVDEGFYNAGPHLYLAMRHVSLPASLGGDPEKGATHFDAVDRITNSRMLISRVFRAQHYAPGLAATPSGAGIEAIQAAQQRAWDAWYGELVKVLAEPGDLWPAQALPNAVAKQRALALLQDPEGNNIIPPAGAENPYAQTAAEGDWSEDDGGGWGDDDDDDDWGE